MKDKIGYRRAKANDLKCGGCINAMHVKIYGIGHEDLGNQYRCTLMGLGASRRYRIYPDHTCNNVVKGDINGK
jgi:hypothetical protein